MKLPVILVNFKGYGKSLGEDPVRLAGVCEYVSKKYGINIIVAPRYEDISKVANVSEIPVFSQHLGSTKSGVYNNNVAEIVKASGASGSLINHYDNKLDLYGVEQCVRSANSCGLTSICCSRSIDESKKVANYNPDFIAYEPPELIGGNVSVSKAKPGVLSEIVEMIEKLDSRMGVFCGAGIKHGEDVRAALDLGAKGVLVSSAVTKSHKPQSVLEEFCRSMYS